MDRKWDDGKVRIRDGTIEPWLVLRYILIRSIKEGDVKSQLWST